MIVVATGSLSYAAFIVVLWLASNRPPGAEQAVMAAIRAAATGFGRAR